MSALAGFVLRLFLRPTTEKLLDALGSDRAWRFFNALVGTLIGVRDRRALPAATAVDRRHTLATGVKR